MQATGVPGGASPRRRLSRALGLGWIADTILGSAIGTLYLDGALEGMPWRARAFAALALVSTIGMLLLIPILPLFVAALVRPARRALGIAHAVLSTAALLLVFADTRVWALFRYHVNGMVWNVLTTPGGQETFEIGPGTWVVVALLTAVVLAGQILLWFRVLAPAGSPAPGRERALSRAWKYGLAALLCAVVVEKSVYALSDARGDRAIAALGRVFPLYQPLTAKRFLIRTFGLETTERQHLAVAEPGLLLRYPLEAPRIDPAGPRPNVLVVVVDSLRADALEPELMPAAWRWSRERARTFADHASGGNATRFGIFSLVYGIHGVYWPTVYAERTPPVLVTELDRLGYDLRVISSPAMTFPEFRATAWTTIGDRVEDEWDVSRKWERDVRVVESFQAWMQRREDRRAGEPFFGFLLIDAPHQTYDWPRDQSPYTPYLDKIDYLEMASKPPPADVEAARNSWRNAVRFSDGLFGRIVGELEKRGLSSSTLVVLTGDHGEEFFEHGYFGHTGNFTRTQVQVTFAMAGPGVPPGVETRPTCHVDLPVTILEMLGADPTGRARWAQGESLLAPLDRRERVVSGWQELAVWVDGGVLHVPLEGHKGLVTALDWDWKPHPGGAAFEREHASAVGDVAWASRTFLR